MTETQVRATLHAFDDAFAAGDAAALAGLFAADARLLLLHAEAIDGRDAIRAHWERLFERYDTSAWRTEPMVIDAYQDRAYTLASYSEILVPRDGGQGQRQLVQGRLVRFLHSDIDGRWRVSLALNSHSRPVEPLE